MLENESSVIMKAGKSNNLHSKMEAFINENNIKTLDQDPTVKFLVDLIKVIKKSCTKLARSCLVISDPKALVVNASQLCLLDRWSAIKMLRLTWLPK